MKLKKAAICFLVCLLVGAMPFGMACVKYDGRASDEAAVYQTSVGIVPAMWITL